MKNKLKKLVAKSPIKKKEPEVNEAAPRITNETVAEHREEVLGTARKYIYPLQHSKHKIVMMSAGLFIVATVAFFSYTILAFYKFQSNSTFLYRVTQVIPFPIARAGKRFVAYENYLFELRHYIHYYENQLEYNFSEPNNAPQLTDFKHRALDKVVNDAYVKQLAKQHGISVSEKEIDNEIAVVRNQNRLGNNEDVFEDVLRDYWGWSVNDFRRSLRQELLAQKVAAALDKDTTHRAESALAEIRGGAKFEDVASKYSDDDRTKEKGGEIPGLISRTDRDFSAETTANLFKLKKGQVSGIVNTGYTLEILKYLDSEGDRIKASHIVFRFKDVSEYTKVLKDTDGARIYISLPPVDSRSQ